MHAVTVVMAITCDSGGRAESGPGYLLSIWTHTDKVAANGRMLVEGNVETFKTLVLY